MKSVYAPPKGYPTMPDLRFEQEWNGAVCGVDEAGRGPWAGPVVAAAVILDPEALPAGINDSKKLTPVRREGVAEEIMTWAVAWHLGVASVDEIDVLNILHANDLAMARAVAGLQVNPSLALIDGNRVPPLSCRGRAIIKGDSLSLSIAAASILAKVYRDRLMVQAAGLFPGYGFEQHKGYGTAQHAEALTRLGPCSIHRKSFAPVRAALRF